MRVTIHVVTEGEWGHTTKKDKQETAERIKRYVLPDESEEKPKHQVTVKIFETTKEATKDLHGVDKLVFLSWVMTPMAREIKKERKRLDVIVLTGLIPEDEIKFVQGNWLCNQDVYEQVFIHK